MTRHHLLVALAGAGAGMVVTSGVAVAATWPHARVQALALWAFWWCLLAAVCAALGLFWWEDEPEPPGEDGPA